VVVIELNALAAIRHQFAQRYFFQQFRKEAVATAPDTRCNRQAARYRIKIYWPNVGHNL
jgi:hypothetical protein